MDTLPPHPFHLFSFTQQIMYYFQEHMASAHHKTYSHAIHIPHIANQYSSYQLYSPIPCINMNFCLAFLTGSPPELLIQTAGIAKSYIQPSVINNCVSHRDNVCTSFSGQTPFLIQTSAKSSMDIILPWSTNWGEGCDALTLPWCQYHL